MTTSKNPEGRHWKPTTNVDATAIPERRVSPRDAMVAARADEALALAIRGIPINKIAETLNISDRWAQKLLRRREQELSRAINKDRSHEIIGGVLAMKADRIKRLYKDLEHKNATITQRTQIAQELREEEKWYWKQLQTIGVVPRDLPSITALGENVQVNQTVDNSTSFQIVWGQPTEPAESVVKDPEFPDRTRKIEKQKKPEAQNGVKQANQALVVIAAPEQATKPQEEPHGSP